MHSTPEMLKVNDGTTGEFISLYNLPIMAKECMHGAKVKVALYSLMVIFIFNMATFGGPAREMR